MLILPYEILLLHKLPHVLLPVPVHRTLRAVDLRPGLVTDASLRCLDVVKLRAGFHTCHVCIFTVCDKTSGSI